MLSSCSRSDSQNCDVPAQSGVSVGFRIALGDSSSTRAGEYDDGTAVEYENYIDFLRNDYCVMFFDTDNHYLASFIPTDLIPLEADPLRSRYYEAIGRIDWSSAAQFPSDFKVVILANWHSYPSNPVNGETTIADICNSAESRYDYVAPFVLAADNTMPMYGVKRFEGVTFSPEMLTYLGTIHMLRAMAKVEVRFPDNGKEWTLESVALNRYNKAGLRAPADVLDEERYVKNGLYEYADNTIIHIADGAVESAEELPFIRLADDRFVVYIPEYRNTAADGKTPLADAAEIRVKFKERTDKYYTVDFKYYENPPEHSSVGDAFDIIRNHYYKFTLSKLTEYDDNLKISIDVDPYDIHDLGPIFGVDK